MNSSVPPHHTLLGTNTPLVPETLLGVISRGPCSAQGSFILNPPNNSDPTWLRKDRVFPWTSERLTRTEGVHAPPIFPLRKPGSLLIGLGNPTQYRDHGPALGAIYTLF